MLMRRLRLNQQERFGQGCRAATLRPEGCSICPPPCTCFHHAARTTQNKLRGVCSPPPAKSLSHVVSENSFQQPVWRAGGRSLGEKAEEGGSRAATATSPPLCSSPDSLSVKDTGARWPEAELCVLFRPFFPWDREAQSCHAEGSGQPVAKHDCGTGGSCLSLSAAPEPGPVTGHREPTPRGYPAHGGPLSRTCARRAQPPSPGPLRRKSRLMWGWAGPVGAAATGSVDTALRAGEDLGASPRGLHLPSLP